MAVQKFRKSKSNTMMRRRKADRRDLPNVSSCGECGGYKLPHRVCPHCGMYKGKNVIKVH